MPKEICCFTGCKKKLTLTSLQCKCEMKFCDVHRYAEDHACTFDYKAEGKTNLQKHMSTAVIAKKLEAI